MYGTHNKLKTNFVFIFFLILYEFNNFSPHTNLMYDMKKLMMMKVSVLLDNFLFN